MAALWNKALRYIFVLWFLLSSSFFFLFFLAYSQDAKNRQKFAVWAASHNCVGLYFATKACIDNRKNTVK